MAITVHPSIHVHPGPWLKRQMVGPRRITVKDLAEHLAVSRQNLSNLLNGRIALSADMALRFEAAFGISAATLLRMQSAHDLATTRAQSGRPAIALLPQAA